MKKIGIVVTGLALVGIVSFGLSSSFTQQAGHADTPAPQRPDLAFNKGDTWSPSYAHGNTGIVSNEAEGDTPAPQKSDLAHGDHGGAPAYDHGRPPAPTNTHGEALI
ncbi:hypothetical protein COD67_04730 [Bacillus cereus]|nr:hypothetical protein COI89_20185 [Bacillus cereus]PGU69407.1 hypothetical protein COD67_04730 [Bacillus cereus]